MDRTRRMARTGTAFALGACALPVFRAVTEAFDNGDATVTNEEELVGLLGALLVGVVAGILASGHEGWLAMLLGVVAVAVVGNWSEAPGELLFIVASSLVLLGIPAMLGYGLGRLGGRLLGRVRRGNP